MALTQEASTVLVILAPVIVSVMTGAEGGRGALLQSILLAQLEAPPPATDTHVFPWH